MSWSKKRGLSKGAPKDFETFWNDYTSWVRFHDLGVEAERCRELIELQGEYSFKAIFRAVLSAYRERTGKQRVGEKTPGHTRYLFRLLDWFPEARVIVTQRDPRAVVASQLRTPYVKERLTPLSLREGVILGSRAHEVAYYAENWRDVFERRVGPWRQDTRLHFVAYEDLVQKTERELRAICGFLEVDFEQAMLTDRSRTTVPIPAGTASSKKWQQWRRKHHQRAFAPVSTDSLKKWQRELSSVEVAMVEGRCATVMQRIGYAFEVPPHRRIAGEALTQAMLSAKSLETKARWAASQGLHSVRETLRMS